MASKREKLRDAVVKAVVRREDAWNSKKFSLRAYLKAARAVHRAVARLKAGTKPPRRGK
jgi:hypothetical protein